jgi:glycosyltransferase involved in cell wall biosynthesis
MKEQIILTMPLKNAEDTVGKSILSFLNQRNTKREIILLIANDDTKDSSINIIQSFLPSPKICLLNTNLGKVYLVRNYLNQFIRENYPNCILIGRLDADDLLYDDNVIADIERKFDETPFDVLMCGNHQQSKGQILEWVNKANIGFLNNQFLLNQLYEMSIGNPKAELPSCNTFIKPSVRIEYPEKESGEDHWFTVLLLLQKERLNIQIAHDLIYGIYSLDGFLSQENRKKEMHQKSRKELFQFYKSKIE